jgi:hypothetical protein
MDLRFIFVYEWRSELPPQCTYKLSWSKHQRGGKILKKVIVFDQNSASFNQIAKLHPSKALYIQSICLILRLPTVCLAFNGLKAKEKAPKSFD